MDAVAVRFQKRNLARRDIANTAGNQFDMLEIEAAAQRRSVAVMLAQIAISQIGVRVKMQHGEVLVATSKVTNRPRRDRMFTTKGHRKLPIHQHLLHNRLQLIERRRDRSGNLRLFQCHNANLAKRLAP